MAGAHQTARFDDPRGLAPAEIAIHKLDGDRIDECALQRLTHPLWCLHAWALRDANMADQPGRVVFRGARHHPDELLKRRTPGWGERHRAGRRQCGRDRDRFSRCEIERRKGGVSVEAVAAARPRLRPDRHSRFLQREQVPLDGARGHLEPLGQVAGAHQPRRSSAQLLDQRVQPIRAVHAAEAYGFVVLNDRYAPCASALCRSKNVSHMR